MSLLSICQSVAADIPVDVPTIIIGSSDGTARLLLACAQREGKALARRPSLGWVSQITEHTFTTFALTTTGNVTSGSLILTGLGSTTGVTPGMTANGSGLLTNSPVASVDSSSQITLSAGFTPVSDEIATDITIGQGDYALPSDFERMVDETLWDRSRFWQMRGAMTPQQWQLYKSSPIGRASIQRRWRIRLATGATAGATPVFSIDPVPSDNGSLLVFEYVSNAWCKSAGGTAQTAWAADTDVGILDEYLIELGITWRMLERLGMDYTAAYSEYSQEVDKAVAADGGTSVIDMTPSGGTFLLNWTNIPETGYGNV
jgi:hypothetical protein